ncbi:MAG: bifunctional diaminohydroxyphosphoribosylaminopyrimidine deaminase/5-amino-6-(5-phosphoribosylamino)uracil reductase RibD [Chthonomonadales bacterium]
MAKVSKEDVRWMRRALRLAAKGFTPPNPMVGCVLVRDGVVVGEGYHRCAGEDHAEVAALKAAAGKARGATAYVTLEPCAHHGRTPPCTQALAAAGVARVVAAVEDPNPLVRGRGLRELAAAGIEVQVSVLEAEARSLNAAFFHYHATGMPYVSLKCAMTLDGKIATRTGDSRWITGPKARAYAHALRARSGAVLCGIGTVLADDPLLTARIPGVPRQPVRIVLDAHLRIPLGSHLVRSIGDAPLWVATAVPSDDDRARRLAQIGVEILVLPADKEGKLFLPALLEELGRRGIISVLVEGGGQVHASFLEAQAAHRIHWFVAPRLVGGADAPSPVEGVGVDRMSAATSVTGLSVRRIGKDLLLEGELQYGGSAAPCDAS